MAPLIANGENESVCVVSNFCRKAEESTLSLWVRCLLGSFLFSHLQNSADRMNSLA